MLVFHAFLFSFIHNTLPLSFSKFAFDDLPSPLSHLMPHHLFTPSYRADLSGFVSTLLRPYRSSHLVAVHANITLLDHNIPYLLLVYITLKLYPTIQSNPIQSNSYSHTCVSNNTNEKEWKQDFASRNNNKSHTRVRLAHHLSNFLPPSRSLPTPKPSTDYLVQKHRRIR